MRSIFHMQSTLKMKLSCHDQLVRVIFVMKTKEENDLAICIGTVYAENYTKLLGAIGLGAVYTKIR